MPSVTVGSLPDELYERITESARENWRSRNSEVIYRLEHCVPPTRKDREALLQEIRALHERMRLPPLTDEFLREAKKLGRP